MTIQKDKRIIFLVGAQATGKTTYVDKMIEKKIFEPDEWDVISTDYFFENLAKKQDKTYSEVWSLDKLNLAIKDTEEKFLEAVKNGKNIIIDNTNLNKRARAFYMQNAPTDYSVEAVIFHINNQNEYKQRLEKRNQSGKVIPYEVVMNAIKKQELPSSSQGFDKITNIDYFETFAKKILIKKQRD